MDTVEDLGTTVLVTLKNIAKENVLDKLASLQKIVKLVATENKLDVKAEAGHQFEPTGASVTYILGSSHLMVHTWPEFKSMTIDVHMCNRDALTSALAICGSLEKATGGKIATQNVINH